MVIKQDPPPDDLDPSFDDGEGDGTPKPAGKRSPYNLKLDRAVAKLVKNIYSGQIVKPEQIQALALAIKWEAVKARITGQGAAGSAFDDPPETED